MKKLNIRGRSEARFDRGCLRRWLLGICAFLGLVAGISAGIDSAQAATDPAPSNTSTESAQEGQSTGEEAASSDDVKTRAVLPKQPLGATKEQFQIPNAAAIQQYATYFFLDAIAQGPTAVYLTWTSVTGATQYALIRNGAKIRDIAPNVTTYRDTGVVPGTTYRYQINAQGAPQVTGGASTQKQPLGFFEGIGKIDKMSRLQEPPPLRASRVMEVVTPPVPTPHNLRAEINGAQVQLSWSSVPGASAYLIARDRQAIGRVNSNPTGFTPTGYADLVPASTGGRHAYAILTAMKGDNQAEFQSGPSSEVNIKLGPLNVLAVGDSVMWGQGLLDQNKFTMKVKDWLQTNVGRPVNLVHLAHSGGIFGPNPPAASEPNAVQGEVPTDFPTLGRQVFTLAPQWIKRKEDIDLILVDGCANDVGLTTIMNPNTTQQMLQDLTRDKCHDKMRTVLSRLSPSEGYTNAKIVVTGYYPAVSQDSDVEDIERLVVGVGASTPVALGLFLGIPPEPISAAIVTGILANELRNKLETLKQKLISNTSTFSSLSTAFLTQAVAESDPSNNRIKFAVPAFTSLNAYHAPQSWLWAIPHPNTAPGTNPENPAHWVNKDEVFDSRWATCDGIQDPTLDDVKCRVASSAHPNVFGAQAYSNAIIGQITGFLPAWRQMFASVQTAP